MVTTASDASNNNTSKDKDNLTHDFVLIARDIQNRGSHAIEAASMEARHFLKFFGMSMRAVKILWNLLVRDNLHPKKSHPKHLPWALYFLKVYPKQSQGCSVLGASASTVNQKTIALGSWPT
jgi:hypothetical protein